MKPFDINQLKKEFSLYCEDVKKYPLLDDTVTGAWGKCSLENYIWMGIVSEFGEFVGAVRASCEPWSTKNRDVLDELGDVLFYIAWALKFGCDEHDWRFVEQALLDRPNLYTSIYEYASLPCHYKERPSALLAHIALLCEKIEPGGFSKAMRKNSEKLRIRARQRELVNAL